jgi:hypothetical protein
MAKTQSKATGEGRKIHIVLSEETHKLLRIRVAELDTTMQDWVAKLIAYNVGPSRNKRNITK